VSTNQGGTLEMCSQEGDGFDMNAVLHFQVLSNELNTPKILVCPGDASRQPAISFQALQSANVSYQLHSGVNETNTQAVLAVCPIHGNVLFCDGSVQQRPGGRRSRR
jgi:prepilin-type processing-associated H-X9-DG protein